MIMTYNFIGHIAEDGSRTERSLVDMLMSPFQTEEYFEAENNCKNEDNLQAASCNAAGESTIHLQSIEAYLFVCLCSRKN